jgi:hypothetical protein
MSETFKHRDIEIIVMPNGYFAARVFGAGEPIDLHSETLSGIRKEIDRVLVSEQNRRIRPSIPVYLYDGKKCDLIEWRGFQLNAGFMLITNAEGKKIRYKLEHWRDEQAARLVPQNLYNEALAAAIDRCRNAETELEAARAALKEAIEPVSVAIPSSYELRRDSEKLELAVRGKLEELERKTRITLIRSIA